jgi:hypothetical protein
MLSAIKRHRPIGRRFLEIRNAAPMHIAHIVPLVMDQTVAEEARAAQL